MIGVSSTSARTFTIDGNEVQRFDQSDKRTAFTVTVGGIVPAGSTYMAFNVGVATWWELR